jgi:hypothetical protein
MKYDPAMPPQPAHSDAGAGIQLTKLLLLPPLFYVLGLFMPDPMVLVAATGLWALGYPAWAARTLWFSSNRWPPGDTWGGVASVIYGATAWLLFIPLIIFLTPRLALSLGWPLVYGCGIAALMIADRKASTPLVAGSGVGFKGGASLISALAALLFAAIIGMRLLKGPPVQNGATFWIPVVCLPLVALFGFLAFKLYGAARAAGRGATPSAASPSAG